jgi:hypothetical protein
VLLKDEVYSLHEYRSFLTTVASYPCYFEAKGNGPFLSLDSKFSGPIPIFDVLKRNTLGAGGHAVA